ncbi:hypothetical protein ACOSQ3_027113 [Xanthoceras sorbifolium]
MEPSHFEAALDGNVNKFPFCDTEREDLSEIFKNVSPSGNSLLHVVSSSGHDQDMTQLIARKFLFLIAKKNSEGNTVLHLVVSAQKLNTIIILNDKGSTALHEALFAVHASKKNVNILVDVACYLVLNDPNITCHQNNAGKTPLCMAIESGNKDILDYILKALLDQGNDEEGNTPLHFAADIGYIEGVRYLIEIKSNWAFERNNKGFYPLHLAFVSKVARSNCLCDKGQSILHEKGTNKLVNKMDKNGSTPFHLAALHCHSMVLFTLLCDKRSKADLVNCQGLIAYDSFKLNILTKDQQIDMNDRNIKASGTVRENSVDVGLKTSKKLKKFQMNSTTTMSQFKIKPTTPKQELNNTINYLFVVAALVVGAAFAGALQIPFDDVSRTDNASTGTGTASSASYSDIINKSNLGYYLINIVITMNLSITAAFTLFLALLLDTNLATKLFSISFLLLELALTFMGSAFYYAMVLRTQNIDDGWSSLLAMQYDLF